MSFAQEIRDFTGAFTAVSNVLGTRSSREAERLDNEYRRATIDWTRAKTAEIGAGSMDLDDYLSNPYDPAPIDATPGDTAATPGTDVAAKSDFVRSSWLTETGLGVPARTGAGAGTVVPTPKAPPARTATGGVVPTPTAKRTAAVDDSDLVGTTGTDTALGTPRADTLAKPDYKVAIRDQTSMRGVQPKTYNILNHANAAARQMGVRLVVTAGAGGGHRSHGSGTELDLIGYHADGSKWTTRERAMIAAAGGRVGANRFGFYPGMSLHIGTAGNGRPSAMWGAGGRVTGNSSRQFTDPADRAFLQAFQNGKLFGASGPASFDQAIASSNYLSPLQRAREAIAHVESQGSGDYGAINTSSGALGRYQVMPQYLGEWSKGAIGRSVSAKEFLANPEIQDAVFDYHFGSLFKKYGNLQDAASAWFTGGPLDSGANKGDGNINGAAYVAKFNKALGLADAGVYNGAGGGGGASAGAVADVEYDTFAKDDDIPAYPASPTAQEDNPMASSTDDTMMDTGAGGLTPAGGSMVPVGDKVHTVEEGDTLWDLAKKYNLETYMQLVEANPGVVGDNPDLIYPGERLNVPAVGDEEVDIPLPRGRPAQEARTKDDRITLESGTKDDLEANVPLPPSRPPSDSPVSALPTQGDDYTPYDYTGGPFKARPGVVGDNVVRQSLPDLTSELSRAYKQITVVSGTEMEPNAKARLLTALTVKIETLKNQIATQTGNAPEAGPLGPATIGKKASDYRSELLERRPEDADALTDSYYKGLQRSDELRGTEGALDLGADEEPIDSADPDAMNAAGMTPPTPERGPVDRNKLTGDSGSDAQMGGRGVDDVGPAQQSIDAVTDSWDISEDGHIVTPEGQKSTSEIFKRGRDAAREGSTWLADNFFPGRDNDAVDLAEDETPDDGSDTGADRLLSGAYAVKKSDMQKVHAVVDAWAARHGVELTESERNMRSLGIMFDYWMTRGEPQKAAAVAGGMLQYYRVKYGQYSSIAQAALINGDNDKAVEAAVKAYAQIPDGRDITVEGDAENGWTFSYINEETGKRISQKVMSPQEVQGMIMGMAPDDIEKFLVKAAGEDEMPEPSAAFSAALDALNATPPGEKPIYDAKSMAYFDSGEASIYGSVFSQKMEEWQQGAAMRDYEKLSGAPVPEAVSGVPPAAAAPTGGGGTAVTGGGTAVTPTTPVAGAEPSATALAHGAAPATLPGGSRQIAPKTWTPGEDGNYGLGDFEQLQITPTETQFGLEWQKLNYEGKKEVYEREKARRDFAYQRWVFDNEMLAPPVPDQNPMTSSTDDTVEPEAAKEYNQPPSDAGIPGAPAFGDRAARLAVGALPTVKGPSENWGLIERPMPDENIQAVLKDKGLADGYATKILKRQNAWDTAKDRINSIYTQQTAVPEPVEWSVSEEQEVESAFTKFPEGFDFTEQEIADGVSEQMKTFVRDKKTALTQLSIRIGQQNEGVTPLVAASTVMGLVTPNPERLGVPHFVAVPHPENANLFMVQPLDVDDSMSGAPLLMRKADLDNVLDLWNNERMRLVNANNEANPIPPTGSLAAKAANTPPPGTPGAPTSPVGALEIGDVPVGLPVQGPTIANPQPAAPNDPSRIPGSQYTQEQIDQMNADPAILEWKRRRDLEKNLSQPVVTPGALDLEREINPWETGPVMGGR